MVISTSSSETSKDMWDTLQLVYRSHDVMSKMHANTKFYSLKMKEHDPMDQFVAQFRLLRLKLAQTGTVLIEQDACMRFLSALPPSYANFVTSQNAALRMAQQITALAGHDVDDVPGLTINELVSAIMQEETTRAMHKSHSKNQVLYMNSKTSNKHQKKPYQRPGQGREKGT